MNYIKWKLKLPLAWKFPTIYLEENESAKGRLVVAPADSEGLAASKTLL